MSPADSLAVYQAGCRAGAENGAIGVAVGILCIFVIRTFWQWAGQKLESGVNTKKT